MLTPLLVRLSEDRLEQMIQAVGRERLVIDLSCRRRGEDYFVVTDHCQKFTELVVNRDTLEGLGRKCSEFLVHAVDVEGLCRGIDSELVQRLSEWSPITVTYAGGARSLADLRRRPRRAP